MEEQEPETKQTVLAVCFETSLLARELIENTILADDIQNNTEKIALRLSEPLPQLIMGLLLG
nr:DNA-cytosine methyltransferase [Proteus terrae subsp. cibarius]